MTEITRLSVLDQSPVAEGATGSDALQNTLDLARLTDALGFHRYWVAEHHGGPSLAGASPEVLIGPIAAATRRLRVGSGGVMLPHYSPLKVAESFSILAGLTPGRIDLGVGRAAGTDPMTSHALQRDRDAAPKDDFTSQLSELLAYLDDAFPSGHPLARYAAALPGTGAPGDGPQPWLLGSSAQSAIWAAQLGLPYAVADFINPDGAANAQLYRERFVPSDRLAQPRVVAAVWTLVADTEAEAERLASSSRMVLALLRRGRLVPVPSPETALRFLQGEGAEAGGRRSVLGTPDLVRARLEQVAADYGAEEVMAVTITHDHEARRRSYEGLADAFGLRAEASEPALVTAG